MFPALESDFSKTFFFLNLQSYEVTGKHWNPFLLQFMP